MCSNVGEIMAGSSLLTKKFIKKNADYQYTTFDNRMRVWVWHQVIIIEVSGTWPPDVVLNHLRSLWGDFNNIRQSWGKAFAIVDCSRFTIQTEAFRYQLKTDWEMLFNRDDLLICLIENNALRRIIRQSIIKLVPGTKNVRMFKEFNQAFRFIQVHMTIEETDIRR